MTRRLVSGLAVLIAAATVVAYSPVLKAGFIELDDSAYVFENRMVKRGLTGEGIRWAFTTGASANWHPVTWMSHMLDWSLYGPNPAGHHATNLALHTVNSVLLLLLLIRLTGSTWGSALVAALFALHPLHVESVAWVSERKDVLSGFFFLLTIWAYVEYAGKVESRKQKAETGLRCLALWGPCARALAWYLVALAFFALGLMSKPMLVTLPFVLLLLDFWPLQRILDSGPAARRQWSVARGLVLAAEKIPFFALSLGSSIVTYIVQGKGHAFALGRSLDLSDRVGNAIVSYVVYLWQTIWPAKLVAFYPYHAWEPETVVGSAALLLAVTGLCLWGMRANKVWFVGWFWFVGMLVPVIGLVQVGIQGHADRYMYLPLVGLLLMLGFGVPPVLARPRAALTASAIGACALVAACGLLTHQQAGRWKDTETLFGHTLSIIPENPMALHIYGLSLMRRDRNWEAAELFQKAIRISPPFTDAYVSLGAALAKQGKLDEAIEVYRTVIGLSPDEMLAHYNLGVALEMKGQFNEAQEEFLQATQLDPEYVQAFAGLGRARYALGRHEQALESFNRALALEPGDDGVRIRAAYCLLALGRLDEGRATLGQALKVPPDSAQAWQQLGLALAALHKWPEAFAAYREALNRDPDSAPTLNNLAWPLATHPDERYRNGAEAVRLAEKACALTHGEQPVLLGTLAAAYAEAGRFTEAQSTAEKAIAGAEKAGLTDALKKNRELLELYKARKPYRDESL